MDTKINFLDCSFRDGGYYNKWKFSLSEYQEYLDRMSKTHYNYLELGFRFHNKKNLGLAAHTPDSLIKKLKLKKIKKKIGVMINASEFIIKNNVDLKILKNQFPKLELLDFVRIACHYQELFKIKKIIKFFSKKPTLEIMVNLMQISEFSHNEIVKATKFINDTKINVFYVADSLGKLNLKSWKKIIKILNKNSEHKLGFHAHDNLELAKKLSIYAIKNRFEFIDSTVLGMGRGPGNLKTEEIYKIFEPNDKFGINNINYLKEKIFQKYKDKYKWGSNKYYRYAALNSIHPTYVQSLLADNRSKKEIKKTILHLSKIKSSSFDPDNLINFSDRKKFKSKNILKKIKIKNKVIIIGSGKISSLSKKTLYKFLKKEGEFSVLATNLNDNINPNHIDFRLTCNTGRLLTKYVDYPKYKNIFILPLKKVSSQMLDYFNEKKVNLFNYNIEYDKSLYFNKKLCRIPYKISIAYSIMFCASRGVKDIYLTGISGSLNEKNIFDETQFFLDEFKKKYKKIFIHII
jgi:4-hydroxy 2-oxovalerate aldolase